MPKALKAPGIDSSLRMTPSPSYRVGGKRFAAIFGATSLVGRHLAQCLASGGFEGLCLSRGKEPAPYEAPAGFSWDSVPSKERLRIPSSAVLFSLVPISALPALVARIDGGDRLIALSTSSVLFKAESSDPGERDLAQGLRRVEEEVQGLCEARMTAWTIFRPTLIYDPGCDANISAIANFVRRFGVFPIVRLGSGRRQPIHAVDVAQAMVAASEASSAQNALFDLPGGETLSYREMVCRIFESLGKRPLLLHLPLGPARMAFFVWRAVTGAQYSTASLERMNADLTLDPAPVREALGITCRPFCPKFPE